MPQLYIGRRHRVNVARILNHRFHHAIWRGLGWLGLFSVIAGLLYAVARSA